MKKEPITKEKKRSVKKILRYVLILFLLIWFASSMYSKFKPLPTGINLESQEINISEKDIEFLYDLNYESNTPNKTRIIEQEIFENVFKMVDNGEDFILIDMFLFNTDYTNKTKFIALTTTLKDKLINKKKQNPEIEIVFITDEINNFYGSYTSNEIKELKENNITVIITDSTKLRDVNLIYAGFWRSYLQWLGTEGEGWITHPLGNTEKKVTLRAFLKLMNAKANHRKVIVTKINNTLVSLLTSGNPHEASSLHSNVALLMNGELGKEIIKAETNVAKFSGTIIDLEKFGIINSNNIENQEKNIQLQLLTEKKIRDSLIKEIDSLKQGDELDMVMFYLSDRKVINALLEASERNVTIRLILDANKDAFAREKNGIPNRPVAEELVSKSNGKIEIRWYKTSGEQQHSKIILIKKNKKIILFLGSANLTKRNIGNFNLEMDIKAIFPESLTIAQEINYYFKKLWYNENGIYTLDFKEYKDNSTIKYIIYRIQEATGLSSF